MAANDRYRTHEVAAATEPVGDAKSHPRRVRRLLARKTKRQLAEVLTPRYPDKWEKK